MHLVIFFPLTWTKADCYPSQRAAREDDGSGKGREEQTACDRPCVDLYQISY